MTAVVQYPGRSFTKVHAVSELKELKDSAETGCTSETASSLYLKS
jgi:hypothetical protein